MRPTRSFPAFLWILLAGLVLSGCNTIQGVGKDMSAAGDAISDAAKKQKSR